MDRAKIARLGLLKQRVRDATRARMIDAQTALRVVEESVVEAREAFAHASATLAAIESVTPADLELRASRVMECAARERAAESERVEKSAELEVVRAERIDAEREVKMLSFAEERARTVERLERSRVEHAELDDRAAVRRRSA